MKKILFAAVALLFAQASSAAITNLTASHDATNVTISYSYTGAPAYVRLYLDTDRNATTGYPMSGIGANFLVENSALYRYSGTNGSWAWTQVQTVTTNQAAPNVRWTMARSLLGSPTGITLIANTSANETSSAMTYLLTSNPPPTTTTVPASAWIRCATENGTCSFSGTRQVRYGANGTYAYKTATGSIACNNATFGDPVPGMTKFCDYSNTLIPTTTTLRPPTTTLPPSGGATVNVSYSGSSANIVNPERGFFWMTDCRANPRSATALRATRTADGHSVVHCLWYLREFRSSPLSATVISQLQSQLNEVRAAGFKMILRFAYTSTDINDAPVAVVSGHLDQLRATIQQNADVITTIQVGIIGQWGEMSTSSNYGNPTTSQDWANRKAVVDKLLSVVPASRMVAVRTPAFKTNPYGSSPLTDAEAFSGSARARVSHYNDCFISSANDWGTYLNPSVEIPYLQQDSKFLAMSGETCSLNVRNDCSNAVAEMSKLHWSLLHQGYNESVINKWKDPNNSCFGTIHQRLGYRFALSNAAFSSSARVGGTMSVALTLQNNGFAALYNQRNVELVLRNNSTGAIYRVNLNSDPRRWLPGTSISINQTVALPAGIPAGSYALLLNLPDPAQSLYGRPEYSIQLANSNVWEAATGFNKLNHNVTVNP